MRASVVLRVALALALSSGCSSSEESVAATPLPAEELDASTDVAADDVAAPDDTRADDVAVDTAVDTGTPKDAAPDAPRDVVVTGDAGDCKTRLKNEGVDFDLATARGVVDAVKIKSALHGVTFTSGTATTPMGDPVACSFAHTLLKFADLVKSKGFVRVGTLGSYCYRCCCSWSSTNFCRGTNDPEPDCSANGYSNHSFGRAVDVRYLYKADGTRYDINDATHWKIGSASTTCTSGLAAQTGISRELYQVACDASALKIFAVSLTPNYNDAHRNHLHMDIGQTGTPTSWVTRVFSQGVDSLPEGTADDHCGGE